MSPLEAFCAEAGLTLDALARLADIDASRLRAAIRGEVRLTRLEADRLAAKTGEALTSADMLALGDDGQQNVIHTFPPRRESAEAPIDPRWLSGVLYGALIGLTEAGPAELERLCDLGAEAAVNAYPALEGVTACEPDDRLALILTTVLGEILKEAPKRRAFCPARLARRIARVHAR